MSTLVDQATRLRHLAQGMEIAQPKSLRGTHRAHVVAVASGKGGVGKTNIAVNLAIALAEARRDTILIDGDFGLGNADMLCGLNPSKHVGAVLDGRKTLGEIAVPYRPGLRLVPCGSGVASLAELDPERRGRFMEAFAEIERTAEVLIIDCGAGLGAVVLNLLTLADTTLVVTTPEPTSIADAYGLIKTVALREPRPAINSLALVVNQSTSANEAKHVHARMQAVCDRFLGTGLQFAGKVSIDPHVSRSVRMRMPFIVAHPKCNASIDVRNLSARLEQGLMPRRAVQDRAGLLERLWRLTRGTD